MILKDIIYGNDLLDYIQFHFTETKPNQISVLKDVDPKTFNHIYVLADELGLGVKKNAVTLEILHNYGYLILIKKI